MVEKVFFTSGREKSSRPRRFLSLARLYIYKCGYTVMMIVSRKILNQQKVSKSDFNHYTKEDYQ
jgi:hypothetical protein